MACATAVVEETTATIRDTKDAPKLLIPVQES